MRAVVITEPGGPEVLSVSQVAAPPTEQGEVLIDVVAAGLNRADVQQRQGHYPPPAGAPEYPGLEVSGRVADPGASGFAVGDEVVALLAGGGYAEQVAVPAGQVLPVPAGVDLVAAAALPEVVATVYSNLFLTAQLQPGERVLIHGGSGGIGTMAIQLALAFGAIPIVTGGSAGKLEVARSLGAATCINYREQDFVAEVAAVTGGKGVDVILDVVGAKYLARNVESLATGGRLVVIGLQGGAKAELNLGALMTKRALVAGTTLRGRPVAEKASIMAAVRDHVWPLIASGSVAGMVDRTFPLDDVVAAHQYFDSGEHTGKILLTIDPAH
ncbi:NADPH2:quinone reductase [Arthrobacter sp. CAN_A212]|uniref:NAD(P)H-quinone oxidoreductase n=1 Tax=unclassified Arthrobacter TaxID=235627 RepID=UPI0018CB138F|nr:NAD(P)H-quinone oxidoreductase [Arthrobacter sp. CAN_C5]MBP2218234.1 NADPH2:quinone reductase [Arthrobacter sp. CAN_C5]